MRILKTGSGPLRRDQMGDFGAWQWLQGFPMMTEQETTLQVTACLQSHRPVRAAAAESKHSAVHPPFCIPNTLSPAPLAHCAVQQQIRVMSISQFHRRGSGCALVRRS